MSRVPQATENARWATTGAAVLLWVLALPFTAAWLTSEPTVRAHGAPGTELTVAGPADRGEPAPVALQLWVSPPAEEPALRRVGCTVEEVLLRSDDPGRWRLFAIGFLAAAPLMSLWAWALWVVSRPRRGGSARPTG